MLLFLGGETMNLERVRKEIKKINADNKKQMTLMKYMIEERGTSPQKYKEYMDRLFKSPQTFPLDELKEIFQAVGLDMSLLENISSNPQEKISSLKDKIDKIIYNLFELKEELDNIKEE